MRFLSVLALVASPSVTAAQSYGGHMSGWDGGYGVGMMFGPVLWLLVLGLVVAGVVWFVRQTGGGDSGAKGSGAKAELDMRFARGEIDAEDYAARKKLLNS